MLGPLSADVSGRPLSIGGPIQRRLLASLLARAPAVVPADTLVDDVWGEAAPATAVRTLHSHVTRLRDALGRDGPSATIDTVNGGYRLPLGRGDLDAWIFEDLVRSAQADGDDPRERARLLRTALALWRGPAYGEFLGTPFADAENRRLEELRDAALEARVEAELSAGLGAELVPEIEALVAEHPFRERLWTALVVALYRAGRQADALAAYQRARDVLSDELGVDPGPELRAAEARVLAQDPSLLSTPPPAVATCPWKGLSAYELRDRDFFVGRDRLVTELVARLVDNAVVVVTGPSGSGKSSVVRAGLIPALAGGAVIGSQSWRVCLPSSPDPVRAIEEALADAPELLVIDPMDELLMAAEPDELAGLARRLQAAVGRGTRLVVVVRGDLYGRLSELTGIVSAAGAGTVLVGPPTDDELRDVVQVPSRRVGLTVEPALVDAVVADVSGRPGSLPLLSTALVGTWERRDGTTLTLAGYRAAGGAASALERLAEEAYASMDEPERLAARRILLRLVIDDDGQWRRRRASLGDVAVDPESARALDALASRRLVTVDRDDVQLCHEALTAAWPRLASWLDERSMTGGIVEQVSASARAWQSGGRDPSDLLRGARLLAAIDLATVSPDELGPLEREFIAAGRSEADRELHRLRAGRRRLAYVAAGLLVLLVLAVAAGGLAVRSGQDAARAARVADAQRLGLQALTRTDRAQSLLLAVAAIRLDANPATESNLLAALQAGSAPAMTIPVRDQASSLAVSRDGWLAVSSASGSVDVFDDRLAPAGQFDPQQVWTQGTGTGVVDWLDGHRFLLVGARDPSRLFFMDAGSGGAATFADAWNPTLFEVSGDTKWVAGIPAAPAVGEAPVLLARSVDDSATDVRVPLQSEPVALRPGAGPGIVAVEPTGLEVVDVGQGRVLRSLPVPAGSRIAVSADGKWAAAASADGAVELLDLVGGTTRRIVTGAASVPDHVALSTDGALLAGSGTDGVVHVWSTATGLEQASYTSVLGDVHELAWSPDRSRLFTAPSGVAVVQAWDLSRYASAETPVTAAAPAGAGRVTATAVDPVGRAMAVGSDSGRVWFVDLASGRIRTGATPAGTGQRIVSIAFGDGGRVVLTADVTGVLTIWDASTAEPIRALTGPSGAGIDNPLVPNAPVSPDGRTAASFADGYGLHLVDLGAVQVSEPVFPALGEQTYFEVLGWTPDGGHVVVAARGIGPLGAGGYRDTVGVWALVDPRDGSVVWSVVAPEAVTTPGVAFVDGQRTIVIAGSSGKLHFVDAATGALVGPQLDDASQSLAINETTSPVSLSTSPNGRVLSVVSAPHPLEIWDLTKGQLRGRITVPADTVSAQFVSDSEVVVTTARGAVSVYDLTVADWIDRACTAAGRDLTPGEWAQFLPGYPAEPVCPAPSSLGALS